LHQHKLICFILDIPLVPEETMWPLSTNAQYYKANCFCDSLISVPCIFQKDDPLYKQCLKSFTEAMEESKRKKS
jgi:hypothetical protein